MESALDAVDDMEGEEARADEVMRGEEGFELFAEGAGPGEATGVASELSGTEA